MLKEILTIYPNYSESKLKDISTNIPPHGLILLLVGSVIYLLVSAWLLPWFVGTDAFSFRDPGYNLASGKGFVAENLPTMAPDSKYVFLEYTPIYPLFFGLFSMIAGIGYVQNTIFNCLNDILRSIAMYIVLRRMLRTHMLLSDNISHENIILKTDISLALMAIFVMPLRTGCGDRPENLAVTFQLFIMYLSIPFFFDDPTSSEVKSEKSPSVKKLFLMGIFAGFTFLTSPAIGLFSVVMVFFIVMFCVKWFSVKDYYLFVKNLIYPTIGFIFIVIPTVLFYLIMDKYAFSRFFRHGSHFVAKGFKSMLRGDMTVYLDDLKWAWNIGKDIIIFAVVEIFILFILIAMLRRYIKFNSLKRFLMCLFVVIITCSVFQVVFLFPQFVYMWSMIFISLTCNVFVILSIWFFEGKKHIAILLFICMLSGASVVYAHSGIFWIESIKRPAEQMPKINKIKLLNLIPQGSMVLTTPVHYFLLKNKYYISNPDNVKDWSKYDFMVLPSNGTSYPGKPYVPVFSTENNFTEKWVLVDNTLNTESLSVYGIKITRSSWGYGFALYKNITSGLRYKNIFIK